METVDGADIRNWFKLELLLHRASKIIRNVFKRRWKLHTKDEWEEDNKFFASQVQKENWFKVCGKLQREAIYSGNSNNWDLTTLGIILHNFHFKNLNRNIITSENRHLDIILSVRNKTVHHASKNISNKDFEAFWTNVSNALVALGDSAVDLEKERESNVKGVDFKIVNSRQDETNIKEALSLKEQGNKEFNSNEFRKAINLYTRALQLGGIPDFDKAILYSNRSIAYLKLYKSLNINENNGVEDFLYNAQQDAKQSCILRPNWSKAYLRLGEAYEAKGRYKKALNYFNSAIALDPNNQDLQNSRSSVRKKLAQEQREEHLDPRRQPKTVDEDGWEEAKKILDRKSPSEILSEIQKVINITDTEKECILLSQQAYQYRHGNPQQAAAHYAKAARLGGAEGTYNLARMYMDGEGIKQDIPLGVKMLLEAANMSPFLSNGETLNVGVAEAQCTLGLCYSNGVGVNINNQMAAEWYRKAAKNNLPTACNNLGLMLLYGNGIERDIDEGIHYLKQATNEGDANAMENLAEYYLASGDPMEGLKWIRRAADAGLITAKIRIADFEVAVKEQEDTVDIKELEAWEKERGLDRNNMTLTERVERKLEFEFPKYANIKPKLDELVKIATRPNTSTTYSGDLSTYDYDRLLPCAQSGSVMAQRMCKSQEHLYNAVLIIQDNLTLNSLPPIQDCIDCVIELAKGYKIEQFCMAMPEPIQTKLINVTKYVISHFKNKTSEADESARICYAVQHLEDLRANIQFLNICIKLYPKNMYFYLFRGASYAFLKQFERTIEDIDIGLKLQPNDNTLLYHKAASLRNIRKSKPKQIIDAYKEFLKYAPRDERKVPEAYYCISFQYHMESNEKWREYYKLALEAEKIQLFCFLPYDSNSKKLLEFSNMDLNSNENDPPSNSAPKKEYIKARSDSDIRIFLDHRKAAADIRTQLGNNYLSKVSVTPKLQGAPISLIGLRPIHFSKMDEFEDHVYKGYVLSVVVADIPVTYGSSIISVIEDEKKRVQRLAVYGHNTLGICFRCKQANNSSCKAHEFGMIEQFMYKEYPVGTKLSIIHPYIRKAADGKRGIRVDDITTIIKEKALVEPCRCCLAENATKFCGSCKIARYCSKECQEYDWKTLNHKNICFNFEK